jgi:DNA-binding MarR family transcriptional regulator
MYRAIDAEMSRVGMLPLDWYDALLSLERTPGSRLRLSELAESALLSRSGVSRLVDRLETAGLLRREECPSDRRGAFAVLTDAGREALAQAWPFYEAAVMNEFAQFLSDDEARVLASLLEKIATTVPLSSIKKVSRRQQD